MAKAPRRCPTALSAATASPRLIDPRSLEPSAVRPDTDGCRGWLLPYHRQMNIRSHAQQLSDRWAIAALRWSGNQGLDEPLPVQQVSSAATLARTWADDGSGSFSRARNDSPRARPRVGRDTCRATSVCLPGRWRPGLRREPWTERSGVRYRRRLCHGTVSLTAGMAPEGALACFPIREGRSRSPNRAPHRSLGGHMAHRRVLKAPPSVVPTVLHCGAAQRPRGMGQIRHVASRHPASAPGAGWWPPRQPGSVATTRYRHVPGAWSLDDASGLSGWVSALLSAPPRQDALRPDRC